MNPVKQYPATLTLFLLLLLFMGVGFTVLGGFLSLYGNRPDAVSFMMSVGGACIVVCMLLAVICSLQRR